MSFVTAFSSSTAVPKSSSNGAHAAATGGTTGRTMNSSLLSMGRGGVGVGGAVGTAFPTAGGAGSGMGALFVVDVEGGTNPRGGSLGGASRSASMVVEDDHDHDDDYSSESRSDDNSDDDRNSEASSDGSSSLEELQSYGRGDNDFDDGRVMGIQAWPGRRCLDEEFSEAARNDSYKQGTTSSSFYYSGGSIRNCYSNSHVEDDDDEGIARLAVGHALLSTVFRQGTSNTTTTTSSSSSSGGGVPRVVSNDEDDEEQTEKGGDGKSADDTDDDDQDELFRKWQLQLQQNQKKEQQWQLLLATIESANSSSDVGGVGVGAACRRRGHNLSTIVEEEDHDHDDDSINSGDHNGDDSSGDDGVESCHDDGIVMSGVDTDDSVEDPCDDVIDLLLHGSVLVVDAEGDDDVIDDSLVDAWLDRHGEGSGWHGWVSQDDDELDNRGDWSEVSNTKAQFCGSPPPSLRSIAYEHVQATNDTAIAVTSIVKTAMVGPDPSQLWLQLPAILPRVEPDGTSTCQFQPGADVVENHCGDTWSPPGGEQFLLQHTLDCIAALAFCG